MVSRHLQGAMEGGFMGRTNKLVDGCYSFWQGGLFPLLQRLWPDYLAQTRIPGAPIHHHSTCLAIHLGIAKCHRDPQYPLLPPLCPYELAQTRMPDTWPSDARMYSCIWARDLSHRVQHAAWLA